MTKSNKIAMSLAFCLLILATALSSYLIPTQSADSQMVQDLNGTNISQFGGDGYANMAFIYSKTSDFSRSLMVYSFASLAIYNFLYRIRSPKCNYMSLFLISSSILLYLAFFMKDTLVTPIELISLAVIYKSKSKIKPVFKFMTVFALYMVYSIYFRKYYALIAMIWVFILLFSNGNSPQRSLLLMILMSLIIITPKSFFVDLQLARDIVNETRIGLISSGARTAYMNPFEPTGRLSFILNYMYSLYRLNFPIFDFGFKELYLFVFIIITSFFSLRGVRSRDVRVRGISYLFLSHQAVYIIFEPDIGSYFRHMSTVILLLYPSISEYDSYTVNKKSDMSRSMVYLG